MPRNAPASPPNSVAAAAAVASALEARAPRSLLQRLEAQAVRLGALLAQALLLVFLVLVVVAVVEIPLRVAFGRQDVGADAVEEPAIVADHHRRACEFEQRLFE